MNRRFPTQHAMALLAAASLSVVARAQIWSEEFNAGTAPDPAVWTHELGAAGWGNQELQNYTSDSANSRVEDGNLIITALKSGNTITSARLKTQDKLTFTYGTIEARVQTPDLADGLWPAFWTLGNNYSGVGWPSCGELDIMEMGNASAIAYGVVNRRVGSAAHWSHEGSYATYSQHKDLSADINGQFVIYRMEWTPDAVTTYIDNQKIWSMGISEIPAFHEPHFLLLNLAVGGTYTGILSANDVTAPFPAEYKIDYIRIYDNGHTVLGGSSSVEPPNLGTNLLANAGFESGTDGWSESLSGGAAAASTAHVRTGARSLEIDSTGAGDWASPNLSQSFPANPGDVFNLQGYLLNPAADPVSGASFGLLKIEFRAEGGTVLEPAEVEIGGKASAPYHGAESTPLLNADSPADEWIFSEAQATAPEGTASVGFFLLNVNQPGNLGPIHFDDVSAWLIAAPSAPTRLEAKTTNGTVAVGFPSERGVRYELLHATSLTNADWTVSDIIIGNGSNTSVLHEATAPAGFYTITRQPLRTP